MMSVKHVNHYLQCYNVLCYRIIIFDETKLFPFSFLSHDCYQWDAILIDIPKLVLLIEYKTILTHLRTWMHTSIKCTLYMTIYFIGVSEYLVRNLAKSSMLPSL